MAWEPYVTRIRRDLDQLAAASDELLSASSLEYRGDFNRGRYVTIIAPDWAWADPTDELRRLQIPTIDPGFLEREQLSMGPSAFAREYLCSFEALGAGLWSAGQLEALVDARVRPLFPAGEAP